MYNPDTELLFPSRVIPELRDLRGKSWQKLVDDVTGKELTSTDHLAFVLMMARLDGCTTCHADSFRAMGGCTQCAVQNVRRFRGEDKELIALYDQAREELTKKFAKEAGKK
jgi:hypothetical protein